MSNDTAKTETINIVPVQGIFNEDHSIVTFIGPAGDPFYAPLPPGGGVTSFDGGTTGLTPATATSGPVTLGGTLSTNNGGTGGTAGATAGGVAYGNGTAYAFTSAGTSGYVLTSNGASAPTWEPSSGGGSLSITDDTTTNNTRYPLFSTVTTGTVTTEYTSSTKYTYNPSSGTLAATAFSGSGAALTALNASNVSSGTLSVSYGGTGVTSTATDGQLLIGNGSGYTLSTLTAGSNVTITNSAGGITIAASGGGGSSLSITDTTTNATFYPTFTSATSGTISTEYINSTALTFNPSTGAFSVAGQIYSSSGGYKFPDGTVQTTASSGGGGGSNAQAQAYAWFIH